MILFIHFPNEQWIPARANMLMEDRLTNNSPRVVLWHVSCIQEILGFIVDFIRVLKSLRVKDKRKNQFVFLSIFHFGIEIVMLCSVDTLVTTGQWQIWSFNWFLTFSLAWFFFWCCNLFRKVTKQYQVKGREALSKI